MYENIKNLLQNDFLKSNETLLRNVVYVFYKGNKKECPVCQKKLRKFVSLDNGELLCPYCGSLPRHRRLWLLIEPLLSDGVSVLDISPPRCFYKKFRSLKSISYTASDFAGEFMADLSLDLTNTRMPSDEFDIITCFHVLEHIEKDEKAMLELHRILKAGGKCFVQTPFKNGDIYEDFTITSPQERKIHFGQEDHVRIYSVEGLRSRLEKAGFKIEILSFAAEMDNYFGLSATEKILVATK